MECDKCGGHRLDWSEFKGLIWCRRCKLDTRGTGGIFDGPIPLELSKMFGLSFDRINLKTKKLMKMVEQKNGKIVWIEQGEK
jgi:hypothetical protein